MREPNTLAKQFAHRLQVISDARDCERTDNETADKLHIQTAGASLTYFYESLRNASENAGENLLLMRAIRRFFKRAYLTPDLQLNDVVEELIIELTLAGYLENDSIALKTIDEITHLVRDYSSLRNKLLQKFSRDIVDRWTLEPMSAAIEQKLRDHRLHAAFADFAYNYFLNAIDVTAVFNEKPASYEATLFMAVQQALLHSDPADVRLSLISRYQIPLSRTVQFAEFNTQIDQIVAGPALKKLNNLVDRHGASLRIAFLAASNDDSAAKRLASEKSYVERYNLAINESYSSVSKNINRGIFRSVIFLVITKFIIGIAAEVPYDIWVHGAVQWLPLIVNLALPPLYMVALRLTLLMPTEGNTRALDREITRILFEPVPVKPYIRGRQKTFGAGWNTAYGLLVVAVFAGVTWLLINYANFEWIHLVVFFVFISTASFLGFRLSRSIREIEVGDEAQTSVTMIRDFLYMPFVAVGRKINETYAKINLVSRFLDMFVELPLKTILGFVRRWGSFLNAKKDDF
ncbi:MAG: hypothetical protein LBQ11_01790 [Candidatus Nomurabacteria bacterium]|jgi:hypothetical protein|nr:hypothetical protein [Candidatus Nomurabacteria bacterium]